MISRLTPAEMAELDDRIVAYLGQIGHALVGGYRRGITIVDLAMALGENYGRVQRRTLALTRTD